jgi:hypothetical protein
MKASDMLRNNNGLKTTQSVLNKQQSGVDAAQKVAQTQAPVFTQQQLDAAGKKVDQMNAATPTDDAMKAARAKTIATQQAIANGVDVNQGSPSDEEDKPSVPIVKKEEPKPQPKQLSYADMYKILNPEMNETAEQRANREKKERAKARIAALGDGLRALSNIYFATKGAKVVHNPESDMTKAVNKRKAYMDAQREKNRAAWQAGYQRALALDEEARKNNLTLAEQMRYHDNMDRVNRAKVMLDQMRIAKQDEYNKGKLSNQESANKETVRHHKEQESTSKKNANANVTRAQKAGKNKGGSSKENYNKTLAGLTTNDPNGVRAVTKSLKRAGVPQNAQTIVEAYRAHNGGGSTSNNSRAKQLAKKYGF